MTDDGDAPGAAQDLLPLHPAHVVHVRVVFGEAKDPDGDAHEGKINFPKAIFFFEFKSLRNVPNLWYTVAEFGSICVLRDI